MYGAISILEKGYFPKELPPPFSTSRFASVISENEDSLTDSYSQGGQPTKLVKFNLARVGTIRRELGIPNPTNFCALSLWIAANQSELEVSSPISLSGPRPGKGLRAIERKVGISDLDLYKSRFRAGKRFVLQADISRCYPSIYSHSIAWALHTKKVAKSKRTQELTGNRLDTLVRNCQDQQSTGIPIGPDTSSLISEIILSAIDRVLPQPNRKLTGYRYADDYELAFDSRSEAELTLGILQEALGEFGLALNPSKTLITELPIRIDPKWVSDLRTFIFRDQARAQHSDLIAYFDRAFELSGDFPIDPVLNYAVARLGSVTVQIENWELAESLLLQAATNEPGTVQRIVKTFVNYKSAGYSINRILLEEVLNQLILRHAPLGHSSEVAWALWCAIEFRIPIEDAVAKKAMEMEDSVVTLVLLHARDLKLISKNVSTSGPSAKMTIDELYDEHWLLAYEANVKGWLSSATSRDYVAESEEFSFLKRNQVEFYDASKSLKRNELGEGPITSLVYGE